MVARSQVCDRPPLPGMGPKANGGGSLAPGAAGLDVDCGFLGPARQVDAHVDAQAPRDQAPEAGAPRADRVAVAEAGARAPGAARAEEADQRPARAEVPAQLGLDQADLLVLVARHRDAAHFDERQLVERHIAARRARVEAAAEDEIFPGKIGKNLGTVELIV